MVKPTLTYRSRLLLAGACALVAMAAAPRAHAQTAPANQSAAEVKETIMVKAKQRLVREKNSPSAVTELGTAQIQAAGVSASVTSLLRQAPSVFVYQQGLGDNAPTLTIRGLRGLEIATTLDGVPTQDLLAPGSFYLANNLGGPFGTSQISGVSIYPGVASPDKATFGTIGGTIAYQSKRPSDDFYLDVSGSVGSFSTYKEGFELNSGAFDSPLGTGDNAAKVLLSYDNFQSQGFIENTPSRENQMLFAFDKPYDDGLSKFQTTVIYNTGSGLIENEPVPVPYLNKYGMYANYPTNQDSARQSNDYITVIVKDDHYVNDYLTIGGTVFYIHNDQQLNDYGNIDLMVPGGVNGPLTVGGASPFINNPAGFGEAGLYGINGYPINKNGVNGLFYGTPGLPYDQGNLYKIGSKACPNSIAQYYGTVVDQTPCGLNDQITGSSSDTYGAQFRALITPPEIYGIDNTIKVGGMVAKETSPTGYEYLGATAQTPMDAAHMAYSGDGGVQRTIYQGYVQDRLDFLDNSLHITPGATLEGTESSYTNGATFVNPNNTHVVCAQPVDYCAFSSDKWDRDLLPFLNIDYDLDKVMPALTGLSLYGSLGNSALFAPVTDFGPNNAGPPPSASIVHMYEGGIKYDTSKLALSFDYFYQKVDRDFGYFSYQSGPDAGLSIYSGDGQREFKGFEGAVQYNIDDHFQLFGNASWVRARYLTSGLGFVTVAEDQYGVAVRGTPISGIPDYLANFGVDYNNKNMLLDNDAFHVRFSGQYTGEQSTTTDLQGGTFAGNDVKGTGVYGVPGVNGVCYYDSCIPGKAPGSGQLNVFNTFTGATTYDPHGGISPNTIFNLDVSYTMPTPQLPLLKNVTFDLNVQNLFDTHYWQYYYKQVSPASCKVTATNPTGNNYGCTPVFADGIPGMPAGVFFTVKARF